LPIICLLSQAMPSGKYSAFPFDGCSSAYGRAYAATRAAGTSDVGIALSKMRGTHTFSSTDATRHSNAIRPQPRHGVAVLGAGGVRAAKPSSNCFQAKTDHKLLLACVWGVLAGWEGGFFGWNTVRVWRDGSKCLQRAVEHDELSVAKVRSELSPSGT
jgi:hypothetical protein